MKKFLLTVCVLLVCTVASHAQAEYPDVPFEDSAYADMNLLVEPSIDFSCYHSSSSKMRAMTRYEFAVVIARLIPMVDEEASGKKPLHPTALVKPVDIAALKRLSQKFSVELKELGIDIEQVKINGVFLIERQSAPVKSQNMAEYPDVPLDDSAYIDINILVQAGVVEEMSRCYGPSTMTRYEFAVMVARLLENLGNGTIDNKTSFALVKVEPNTAEAAALRRLADNFRPELKALGVDIATIKINGIFLFEQQSTLAKSQDINKNPDVPFEDSAYADLSLLDPEAKSIFERNRNRLTTRYEFAVNVARLLENLSEKTTDNKNLAIPFPIITLSSTDAAALKRLANKFLTELRELGVDVEQIRINDVFLIEPKINSNKIQVAAPFTDVPKNHWAFNATEKLRQSGILVGYPNGSSVRSG